MATQTDFLIELSVLNGWAARPSGMINIGLMSFHKKDVDVRIHTRTIEFGASVLYLIHNLLNDGIDGNEE